MRTHYLQNSTTPCTSDVFVLTFKPIVSNTSIGFSPTTIAGEVLATSQSRKHLASVLLLGVVMKQTAKPLTLVWSDPIITTYYIRPYYSGEGQTKFLQHTTVRLFLAAAFRHFSVFSKKYQLWKRCPHAIQTQWRVRNPPPLWVQFLKYDTWILSLCLGMALLKEQLFCTVVLNVNEDIKVTYKHPDRQPDMSQSVSMLQKGHTGHHSLQALFTNRESESFRRARTSVCLMSLCFWCSWCGWWLGQSGLRSSSYWRNGTNEKSGRSWFETGQHCGQTASGRISGLRAPSQTHMVDWLWQT